MGSSITLEAAQLLQENEYPTYSWTDGVNCRIEGGTLHIEEHYMQEDQYGSLVSWGVAKSLEITIASDGEIGLDKIMGLEDFF